MRARQALKLTNKLASQQGIYTKGQLRTALRTIWHRSRHAEGVSRGGMRMGGSISDRTVRTVVNTLLEHRGVK